MCSCYVKSRRKSIARMMREQHRYLHFLSFYSRDTEQWCNVARSENTERKTTAIQFLENSICNTVFIYYSTSRMQRSIKRIYKSRCVFDGTFLFFTIPRVLCRVRIPFPRVFVASQSTILLQYKWKSIKTERSAGSSCSAGRVVGLLPVKTNRERAWPVSLGNRRLLPSTR